MGQILHGGAKTTHAVRNAIQRSKATIAELAERYDLNPKTVTKWQARFAAEGLDGLLRDKTRPPGRKPLSQKVKLKVLKMTARETPPDATHWSVRTMAKAVGISPPLCSASGRRRA